MAKKEKTGRPSAMTPKTIDKLEQAFSLGCSDIEACLYADIAQSTLYLYQKAHPEFSERKERLKEKPMLKARSTIVKSLDQIENAKWYAGKKRKDEFGTSVTLEGGDHPIKITVTDKENV